MWLIFIPIHLTLTVKSDYHLMGSWPPFSVLTVVIFIMQSYIMQGSNPWKQIGGREGSRWIGWASESSLRAAPLLLPISGVWLKSIKSLLLCQPPQISWQMNRCFRKTRMFLALSCLRSYSQMRLRLGLQGDFKGLFSIRAWNTRRSLRRLH